MHEKFKFGIAHSLLSMSNTHCAQARHTHSAFQRGAGRKVQERFKKESAHPRGPVALDLTVLEVCFGVGADIDTSTLPIKRM